jgi:hypothetical protein
LFQLHPHLRSDLTSSAEREREEVCVATSVPCFPCNSTGNFGGVDVAQVQPGSEVMASSSEDVSISTEEATRPFEEESQADAAETDEAVPETILRSHGFRIERLLSLFQLNSYPTQPTESAPSSPPVPAAAHSAARQSKKKAKLRKLVRGSHTTCTQPLSLFEAFSWGDIEQAPAPPKPQPPPPPTATPKGSPWKSPEKKCAFFFFSLLLNLRSHAGREKVSLLEIQRAEAEQKATRESGLNLHASLLLCPQTCAF